MNIKISVLALALTGTLNPTISLARETVSTLTQRQVELDGTKIEVLTNSAGISLYIFDPDTTGDSTCYEGCARAWPPVLVTIDEAQSLSAELSTTVRRDKSLQLRFKGQPLYKYVGDSAPGDIEGEGIGGVWHLVQLGKPDLVVVEDIAP